MQQTVSEILTAISRELGRLTELASALQDQLSARGYDARDVEGLQSLDSLHQTLGCLTTYVADIATVAPCHCRIDIDRAAGKLCLTALANRLRGKSPQSPANVDTELF